MRYVYARLGRAALLGVVAAFVALAVLLPKCEGPGPHPFTRTASVTTTPPPGEVVPPRQVVDDLYKSLVLILPREGTLICILTRLPVSFPHFTIPPEYSCVRAPGSR